MNKQRTPRGVARRIAMAAIAVLALAAARHAAAAPTFPGPYYLYDEFLVDGSAPDATKWIENDAANKMNVSGGFLTFQRTGSDEYAESIPSALVWPVGVETWFYETSFVVDNDGQELSGAALFNGANPGFGGRDILVFIANGVNPSTSNPDPAYFGIGVNGVVPARDFIRGLPYTVTAVHNAAGAPGYSDDTLDIYVNGVLYNTTTSLADGSGAFGPPPVVRPGSNGFTLSMDYFAVGPVPEPASLLLLAAGSLVVLRRTGHRTRTSLHPPGSR